MLVALPQSRKQKKKAKKLALIPAGTSSPPIKETVTVRVRKQRKARARRMPMGPQVTREGTNPYLATLLDPDGVRGVKIPDPITLPSSTYTWEADGTVTQVDGSGGMVIILNPYGLLNSTGSAAANAALLMGNNVAGFGSGANPLVSAVNNPTLNGVIGQFRVVSAELVAYSTGAPLNTTGRSCTWILPKAASLVGSTFNAFSNLPYSFTDHAAKGARVKWMPTDLSEHIYTNEGGSTTYTVNTFSSGSYASGGAPNTSGNVPGTVIGIAFAGLQQNPVAWKVVVNLEFIPAADALDFVSRDLSLANQGWMDEAVQFIQRNQNAFLSGGKALLAAAVDTVLPGAGAIASLAGDFAKGVLLKHDVPKRVLGSNRARGQGNFPY